MAKRKAGNPFLGRWLIEEMDQWDVEDESEELPPFIEFERGNTGLFQFACVHGEMNCPPSSLLGTAMTNRSMCLGGDGPS
jgi:hypothetical protein